MYYMTAMAAFIATMFLTVAAQAQSSWEGFYGGLSIDANQVKSNVGSNATHRNKEKSGLLGLYTGYNFSNGSGFVWGPEVALTGLSIDATKTDAALGTSVQSGSYLLQGKLRAGWASDRLFAYGVAGVGMTNASLRPQGTGSKRHTTGLTYGLGLEMALGNGAWSTRIEATSTDMGGDTYSFNGSSQKTSMKLRRLTLGLSRKF